MASNYHDVFGVLIRMEPPVVKERRVKINSWGFGLTMIRIQLLHNRSPHDTLTLGKSSNLFP